MNVENTTPATETPKAAEAPKAKKAAPKAKAKKAAPKAKAKKAAPKAKAKKASGKKSDGAPRAGVLGAIAELLKKGKPGMTAEAMADTLSKRFGRKRDAVLCTVRQQMSKLPGNPNYGIKEIKRQRQEGSSQMLYWA